MSHDKSDNACYQVPADIADKKITENTTLGMAPVVAKPHCFTEVRSGSGGGSYSTLADFCITHL